MLAAPARSAANPLLLVLQDFVLAVHARAAAARSAGQLSTRADMLLDVVVEVKNNRAGGGKDGAQGAAMSPVQQRLLKQWGVGQVLLRGMTWPRLLARDSHKVLCSLLCSWGKPHIDAWRWSAAQAPCGHTCKSI